MGIGGTERQVLEMAKGLRSKKFDVLIYSLFQIGTSSGELKNFHIPYRTIRLESIGVNTMRTFKLFRFNKLLTLFRFLRFSNSKQFTALVKKDQPDIIYSFGIIPNILAVLIKKKFKTKVIWGIRNTFDRNLNLLLLRVFSPRFVDLVISNSTAGKNLYFENIFPSKKIVVISNGIDVNKFKPRPESGLKLRKRLCLGKNDLVIGHLARLDPLKDHKTFLYAVSIFIKKYPQAKFLIAGGGKLKYESELKLLASNLQIEQNLIWLGEYYDTPSYYNAIDFLTLTSISEGFPNVLGEAMACGKPCVVTDVGDCKVIVEGTGIVVPKSDPDTLDKEWKNMAMKIKKDKNLSTLCRTTIVNNYSLNKLIKRTTEAIALL